MFTETQPSLALRVSEEQSTTEREVALGRRLFGKAPSPNVDIARTGSPRSLSDLTASARQLPLPANRDALLDAYGLTHSEVSPEANYKAYYRWSSLVARALRKPPYRIVPNATLNALALRRPTTLEELLRVPGLGKRRALRYHVELLEVGKALASVEPDAVEV